MNMSQQCALVARRATSLLDCTRQRAASRSREGIFHLCSALVRHIWSSGASAGLPSTRETWTCWSPSSEGTMKMRRLELLSCEKD